MPQNPFGEKSKLILVMASQPRSMMSYGATRLQCVGQWEIWSPEYSVAHPGRFSSLSPKRCNYDFKYLNFKHNLGIYIFSI